MTKNNSQLIHCITNPISINQCANLVLALDAKPIMAEHPREVREITATADALLVNLGNITDARMKSIKISVKEANKKGIPIVLDAVGVACSRLRRKFAMKLLDRFSFTLIKGNYSEIVALAENGYTAKGVDGDNALSSDTVDISAKKLSVKYKCIILASGETDIIADGKSTTHIHGGTVQLSRVTGTGCMLGIVCSCYLAKSAETSSVISACDFFKKCGKASETTDGNGSFMTNLINNLGGTL